MTSTQATDLITAVILGVLLLYVGIALHGHWIGKKLDLILHAINEPTSVNDIQCPVCGYYCTGKGGRGCIDKPTIVEKVQHPHLCNLQ